MVNKKLIGIVAVIVIVVAGGFFGAGGTNLFAAKSSGNVIESGVTKDCSSTPWVVAQEKGFFKKYGINFKDVGQIAPPQQPAAFLSGKTNVFEGHPNTFINLVKSGAKIKAVAVVGAEPLNDSIDWEHMHWLVKEDSPLKTAEDFKTFTEKNGRKVKIAVGANGICSDLETNAWFRKNNISNDTYEYVVLADDQQESALIQGSIDVAVLHPPFYAKAEKDSDETSDHNKKLRILLHSSDAFGPAAGMTLLAFNEEFIDKYPGTVRDFTNAYLDAVTWSDNNRQEAGELTAKFINLPYTSNVHWYSQSGAFNNVSIGYLQEWIDAMVIDGYLKEGEITPEDIYTTEFKDTWRNDKPDN